MKTLFLTVTMNLKLKFLSMMMNVMADGRVMAVASMILRT